MAPREAHGASDGDRFAECMKELVDVHYPGVESIRVVMDNLSTHTHGALYEAFEPDEARRILRKLEFHFVPKHGSWLNMAEIEIGVLRAQCIERRIDNVDELRTEVAAWEMERNAANATIEWSFTTEKARAKMGNAYPKPSRSAADGQSNETDTMNPASTRDASPEEAFEASLVIETSPTAAANSSPTEAVETSSVVPSSVSKQRVKPMRTQADGTTAKLASRRPRSRFMATPTIPKQRPTKKRAKPAAVARAG